MLKNSVGWLILGLMFFPFGAFAYQQPAIGDKIIDRKKCYEGLREKIANAGLPTSAPSGDATADQYIANLKNRIINLHGNLKAKDYLWDVHPGTNYPYRLKVTQTFVRSSENAEVDYSIRQERLAGQFFSFIVTTTYSDQNSSISVNQEWDVDQECLLRLHRTNSVEKRLRDGRIEFREQDIGVNGARPVNTATALLPSDGPFFISIVPIESKEELEMFLREVTQYPQFYVPGNYQVPVIKTNMIGEEITHFDPVVGRDMKMEGVQISAEIKGVKIKAAGAYSNESIFSTAIDASGTEEWRLPKELWSMGVIPELQHPPSDVSYGLNATDDEEPEKVEVITNVPLSAYDHFASYWKIARAVPGLAVNLVKYDLISREKIDLSSAQYPAWKAPAGSPYLASSNLVQTHIPYVEDVARRIREKVGPDAPNTRIASEIVSTLSEKFQYDYRALEVGGNVVDLPTSELIKQKLITCQNFANLFAAIARSMGIPTRIVAGFQLGAEASGHAWNEIEVANEVWLPLDPQNPYLRMFKGFYLPLFVEEKDTYDIKIEPNAQRLGGHYGIHIQSSRPLTF